MSNPKADIPRRALSTNFTERTLARSILAKKRHERYRQIKGLFTMKKTTFLKQPVGALVAVAIVACSSVGAYAALNWFNGDVKVTGDNSALSVDLSQCKSSSAVDIVGAHGQNLKDVKYKILGNPHIDAKTLQTRLLAECEFGSVLDVFNKHSDATPHGVQSSVVKSINGTTVVLESTWGGKVTDKTFTLSNDTKYFDKGQVASRDAIKAGDMVVYRYEVRDFMENENPLDKVDVVDALFKTQYDTRQSVHTTKAFYTENNIMPFTEYTTLNNK